MDFFFGTTERVAGDATVTRTTACDKFCSSLGCAFFGLFFFFVAFFLTFWNEGNFVTASQAIDAARDNYRIIGCDDATSLKSAWGTNTLVFLRNCPVNKMAKLGYKPLNLTVTALALDTDVEMFQWTEVERTINQNNNDGSTTTYRWHVHELGWYDRPHVSPRHCHQERYNTPCTRRACTGGYVFPGSSLRNPHPLSTEAQLGSCNPTTMPTSPAEGTQYAPPLTVQIGAAAFMSKTMIDSLRYSAARPVVPPASALASLSAPAAKLPVSAFDKTNSWHLSDRPGEAYSWGGGIGSFSSLNAPRVGDVRS